MKDGDDCDAGGSAADDPGGDYISPLFDNEENRDCEKECEVGTRV